MSGNHERGTAVNARDVKKAVKAHHREIISFLSKVLQTPSVTGDEAADIVKATGMPMPILGPGNEDEATSVDEKLSIEEYLAAVEIYALTVARLLSTSPGGTV